MIFGFQSSASGVMGFGLRKVRDFKFLAVRRCWFSELTNAQEGRQLAFDFQCRPNKGPAVNGLGFRV